METSRRKAHVNSKQIACLVKFLSKHSCMSTHMGSLTSKVRNDLDRLWKIVVRHLNELGPPVKTLKNWKRSWFDYKYKVKIKLRQINKINDANPLKQVNIGRVLNEHEQIVADLLKKVEIFKKANAKDIKTVRSENSIDTEMININSSKSDNTNICIKTEPDDDTVIFSESINVDMEISDSMNTTTNTSAEIPSTPDKNKSPEERSKTTTNTKKFQPPKTFFERYVIVLEEGLKIKNELLNIKKEKHEFNAKLVQLKERSIDLKQQKFERDAKFEREKIKLMRSTLELQLETNRLKIMESK